MQPTPHYGPVEIWQSMGFVGHLVLFALLLMSIYSTGVMIDRWRLLRRAGQQSRAFLRGARHLLAAGQLPDLLSEAEKHPQSHIARIYSAAILEAAPWADTDLPADVLEESIRRATERESVTIGQEFKHGLSGLASIGSTAPFVGLFGTVIGIMNSFFGMAATGSGGLGAVSGGIAEALVNTAAGILVALPAVWGFNYFLGRLERVHSEMANAGSELVDYFMKRARSEQWTLEATTGRPVSR